MKKLYGKPVKFVRWGGLSPVKQIGYDPAMPTYHSPPAKKGIYAFVWPYIELFLLTGNEVIKNNHKWQKTGKIILYPGSNYSEPEVKLQKPRKFTYEGDIWHHLGNNLHGAKILQIKGKWFLTSFNDFVEALGKELHKMKWSIFPTLKTIPNNPTSHWAKDHLEVFIERP